MENCVEKVILNEMDLSDIVKKLGNQISKDYKDKNLLMVSILKGSIIFMSDLMREINIPCKIDFMSVSSYNGGVKSSGVVKISKDLDISIEGYDLLIVEDILDSGITLDYIINTLKARNPRSIKICTLLDKPKRRTANIKADYVGKEIPDEFIIGYGLDYDEKYRNLPFIGIANPALYS